MESDPGPKAKAIRSDPEPLRSGSWAAGLNRLARGTEATEYAAQMNSKAPVIILIVLCIGLGVGLLLRHNKAVDEQKAAAAERNDLMQRLAQAEAREQALQSTNSTLQTDRDTTRAALQQTSAQLGDTKSQLDQTRAAVEAAEATLKEKETEIAKRESRITELESRNSDLDRQATEMKGAITSLEGRISDTQKRLETAEGDREVLLEELHRLQTEKAEMERRLNDVVALKEQITRLRDQLSVSRQLEAIRRNLYGAEPVKGGELLQRGMRPTPPAEGRRDLDVEIRRDGSATILSVPTNAPAPQP